MNLNVEKMRDEFGNLLLRALLAESNVIRLEQEKAELAARLAEHETEPEPAT